MTSLKSFNGKQFNQLYTNCKFIMLVTIWDKKYKTGFNIWTKNNEDNNKNLLGFRFIDVNNLIKYLCLDMQTCYYEVILPDDAIIYKDKNCYFSTKLLLGEKKYIKDIEYWKDAEFCKKIVSKEWCRDALSYTKVRNPEIYSAAITKYPESLKYIDAKEQTEELCFMAVSKNGLTLQWIYNSKYKTPKMYMTAVQQNGHAIMFIEDQTNELCLAAVRQVGLVLKHIKHQTHEICLAAIRGHGIFSLKDVKDQTPELCMAAVKQNGIELCYVKNKTYDICIEAVKQTYLALMYIDKEEKTPEMYLAAVQQNGNALSLIDSPIFDKLDDHTFNNQTFNVCLAAVQQNGFALHFVKDKHMAKQLKDIAFQQVKEEYLEYCDFIQQYKKLLLEKKTIDEQIKWIFSTYSINHIKQLMQYKKKLYDEIYGHTETFDFDNMKPIFELYNIKYMDKKNLNSALMIDELIDEHYKLNYAITFLNINDIFDYIMGDLTILLNDDIKELMNLDFDFVFDDLYVQNNDIMYSEDIDNFDDHDFYKYYINGQYMSKKLDKLDNFI